VLSIVALVTLATPVLGEDDFPLVGTYTENQACKGDGSDSGVSRVKITMRDIDSVFGLCTILSRKREGATFAVHVECKGPGGSQMLGDVNFTPRDDKIIDFSDQDQTYKATLYKCPEVSSRRVRGLSKSSTCPALRGIFVRRAQFPACIVHWRWPRPQLSG
jgi:hypothetical protein